MNENEWIDKLDLNPYIEIELKRNGIYTIEELNAKSNHELCAYPGLRLPHVNEIVEKLNVYHFGSTDDHSHDEVKYRVDKWLDEDCPWYVDSFRELRNIQQRTNRSIIVKYDKLIKGEFDRSDWDIRYQYDDEYILVRKQ